MKPTLYLPIICVVILSGGAFVDAAPNTAKSPFDLEIPPPETVYPPVLKNLPGSIPQYQSIQKDDFFDDQEILDRGLLPMVSKLKQKESIRVFGADGDLSTIGKVLETESETGLFINSAFIFVKVKKGEAKLLDKLLVVRDRGPLIKTVGTAEYSAKGNIIQINCEIQLTSRTESETPDPEFDYFRAKVIKAINLSERGNSIIRGQIETTTLDANGPRSNVLAEIIGGENDTRSTLFGAGTFVFLNKGSNDGLKVGDILPVYVNRRFRNERTEIVASTNSEGILKVVHVDTGIATALIVKSNVGFRQGDRTGTLAQNSVEDTNTQTESIEEFDLPE